MSEFFTISSAGTSDEEEGNAVDRRAQSMLAQHGISAAGKYARQLQAKEFKEYDYFLCMDSRNLASTNRLFKRIFPTLGIPETLPLHIMK